MAEIDLTPTEEMAANAARGLELRRKHGKGGTEIGVARARDISNRKNLSPETVRRMHAFFSRHEKNKAGGEDDAGYIAWLLWGGDSGQSWAKRKVEQMDKGENQRSDTYKEIAQRLGGAAKNDRPGAKAKFAKRYDAKIVGNELVRSDGRRYRITGRKPSLPNAREMLGEVEWLMMVGENGSEYSVQRFNDGGYRVFGGGGGMRVQWDGLVRASRPGAKAKMAKWESTLTKKYGKPIEEYTARLKGGMFKIEVGEGSGGPYAILYRWDDLRGMERIASGNLQSLMRQAESMGAKEARGVAAIERLANYSRPGAKARHAADILKVEVMDGSTVTSSMSPSDFMAYAKRSLPGIGSTSSLPDMISRFNELAEEKGMRVRVQSNLAKSKNAIREGDKVSASDDAVSRKIRKLMDEGKPQKQAVAIALDLERRGEL